MVWLHPTELDQHKLYLLKHTTRVVRARVTRVCHRVDVDSLAKLEAHSLRMNDIASVEVETTLPLFFDVYREIRSMGSFILIDPLTNATVAAGMIEEAIQGEGLFTGARCGRSVCSRVRGGARPCASGIPPHWCGLRVTGNALQRIERRLFADGWFVHLINASDYETRELIPVVRAFHSAGIDSCAVDRRQHRKPGTTS